MTDELTQPQPRTTKRKKRRVCLAIIVVLTLIVVCSLRSLRNSKSVDEQLAEIDAARAIPPEENAAIIYNQLLQDPNATSPPSPRPEFLDDESFSKTGWKPWLSADYPKLAAWVEERQNTIDKLLAASKFEKCRFPIVIDIDSEQMIQDRMTAMNKWAYLLGLAANNDIAEGRIDAAIAKWRALIRMGMHLRQQLISGYYLMGVQSDSAAMNLSAVYIVEGNAVETSLSRIESIRPDTKDNWNNHAEQMCIVLELFTQKFLQEQLGPIERIELLLEGGIQKGTIKPADLIGLHKVRLRNLASRQGNHILIALRRYKNKHGAWPKSLDEIRPHILPEALIDPFNDGPFLYRLTQKGFELYSTGKNKLDQNGKWRRQAGDDWPIWPPPTRETKVSEESADPNQPGTYTEPIQ